MGDCINHLFASKFGGIGCGEISRFRRQIGAGQGLGVTAVAMAEIATLVINLAAARKDRGIGYGCVSSFFLPTAAA